VSDPGLAAVAVRRQPQGPGGHLHEVVRARPRIRRAYQPSQAGDALRRHRGSARLFLKPYGPGWALVGDAGYHKHAITAFGITDAFRDAEALASALDDAFAERRPYDDAMADYQRARAYDALPVYGFTCEFAKIEPPPPEMQQLIGAMHGSHEAMDGFVSVMAGTLPRPISSTRERRAHDGPRRRWRPRERRAAGWRRVHRFA